MRVTIIDYGLSNLLSVARAVEKLGYTPHVTQKSAEVSGAEILILPGVGAFADGMGGLSRLGMLEPIWGCAQSGVPILGICLGMQMLFEAGHEFGPHRGLGLVPGHVRRLPDTDAGGAPQRVPQVGWNALLPPNAKPGFDGPLLGDTKPGTDVYFVHSFEAKPKDPEDILAICRYGGRDVCAAVGRGQVFGTQFHPEKSGPAGLAILRAFLRHAEGQARRNRSA